MTTPSEISRKTIFDEGSDKLTNLESDLKKLMTTVMSPDGTIDQSLMLSLQFQMQTYTLFVQTIASVQKEFSDMLKGIVSKF